MSQVDWYVEAFTAYYLEYYSHRTNQEALEDVLFAREVLGIQRDQIVLDLCSGAGRHSRNLADICKLVISYDLSFDLLHVAIHEQKKENISNVWPFLGDVRYLPFTNVFDVIVSFFNSFGYFDETSNIKVLERIFKALVPNGKMLLDIMNPNYLRENIQMTTVKETENYRFHEKRNIIESKNRVEKEVIVEARTSGEILKEYKESVQFYEQNEIYSILKSCGFTILGSFGDNKGASYTFESPRHIIAICK